MTAPPETVHVFLSTGRFGSFEEMRSFIDQTYSEDGDGIPSPFMQEIGLSEYEPGCIEAIHSDHSLPLHELLSAASYADQWLPLLERTLNAPRFADAAICVFPPNGADHPEGSSLEYLGALPFHL